MVTATDWAETNEKVIEVRYEERYPINQGTRLTARARAHIMNEVCSGLEQPISPVLVVTSMISLGRRG